MKKFLSLLTAVLITAQAFAFSAIPTLATNSDSSVNSAAPEDVGFFLSSWEDDYNVYVSVSCDREDGIDSADFSLTYDGTSFAYKEVLSSSFYNTKNSSRFGKVSFSGNSVGQNVNSSNFVTFVFELYSDAEGDNFEFALDFKSASAFVDGSSQSVAPYQTEQFFHTLRRVLSVEIIQDPTQTVYDNLVSATGTVWDWNGLMINVHYSDDTEMMYDYSYLQSLYSEGDDFSVNVGPYSAADNSRSVSVDFFGVTSSNEFKLYSKTAAINENTLVTVNSGDANDGNFYFHPSVSGAYAFESYGNYDTVISVYDENNNRIGYDDEGGENSNFRLILNLDSQKTYFIDTSFYYRGTIGSYDFYITNNIFKSASVKTMPDRLDYYDNEEFDYSGLSVLFTYANDNTVLWEYDYDDDADGIEVQIENNDGTVTVSCGGAETSFTLNITKNPIQSVEIETLPDVTTYHYLVSDNHLNVDGLTFKVNYSDGTSGIYGYDLDNGTVNGCEAELTVVSEYGSPTASVTLNLLGRVASFDINISIPTVSTDSSSEITFDGCSMNSHRYSAAYFTPDADGKIAFSIENADDYNYSISIYDCETGRNYNAKMMNLSAGRLYYIYIVNNRNGWEKGTLNVQHMRSITKMEVTNNPDKMTYVEGFFRINNVDLYGISVLLTFDDGTTEIWNGNTEEKIDNYAFGFYTSGKNIVLYYDSVYVNIGVNIIPSPVASISVTSLPDKTEYNCFVKNDNLDVSGIALTVAYNDGTSENVTLENQNQWLNGYSFDFDIESVDAASGEAVVNLSYLGASAQFSLDIVMDSISAETETEITVPENGIKYLLFTPDEDGMYEFYSEGNTDTYGYVYNPDGTSIDSDDDSGEGNNFRIVTELEAGKTYVLGARTYNNSSESFNITMRKCYPITDMTILSLPLNCVVYEGFEDDFSYDGLSLQFTRDNGMSFVWNYNDGRVDNSSVEIVREGQNVTVSWEDFSAEFELTVEDNPVASIEIVTMPDKTEYIENVDGWLDYSGLVVRVNYNDGTRKLVDLSDGTELDGYRFSIGRPEFSLGEKIVSVSYLNRTTYYTITVIENPVASIEVVTMPDKTEYIEGVDSSLERSGMVVQVNYKDGTVDYLNDDNNYEIDGYSLSYSEINFVLGYNEFSLYFCGCTATVPVTVIENPVASIEIVRMPDKTVYLEGVDGWLDYSGMVVQVNYRDGTVDYLNDENNFRIGDNSLSCSYNDLVLGYNEYTLNFCGCTATVSVTAIENPVASIEVVKMPDKTEYVTGSGMCLQYTGMVIQVNYKDGTVGYLNDSNMFRLGNYSLGCYNADLVVGANEFVVEYCGCVTKIPVTAFDNPVASIEIESMPYKTVYIDGIDRYLDSWGLKVKVNYLDGSEKIWGNETGDIDGYSVKLYYSELCIGNLNVTVEFLGRETSFQISVIENPVQSVSVTRLPYKTEYIVGGGESVDSDGLQLTVTFKDGSTEVLDNNTVYMFNGNRYDMSVYGSINSLGENVITTSFMGVLTMFTVTGTDGPVESLEVVNAPDKFNFIIGIDAAYSIDLDGLVIRVNYKDGTSALYSYEKNGMYFNGYYFSYGFNQLEFGDNTVTLSYLGKTVTFNIRGIENPVSRIEVTRAPDRVYYQNDYEHGNTYDNGYYEYRINDFTGIAFTVYYKDGTSKSYTDDDIDGRDEIDGYLCSVDYDNSDLVVGENEITFTYMKCSDTYTVRIEESPVESLEIISQPEMTETLPGFKPLIDGLEVLITYKNGTTKTVSFDDNWVYNGISVGYCSIAIGESILSVVEDYDYENDQSIFKVKYIDCSADLDITQKSVFFDEVTVNVLGIRKDGTNFVADISYKDGISLRITALDSLFYYDFSSPNFESKRGYIRTEYGLIYLSFDKELGKDGAVEYSVYLLDQTITVFPSECVPGDVNADGKVTARDSATLKAYLVDPSTVYIEFSASDVNGDGKVNAKDSVLLSRSLAGWDVGLQ